MIGDLSSLYSICNFIVQAGLGTDDSHLSVRIEEIENTTSGDLLSDISKYVSCRDSWTAHFAASNYEYILILYLPC